MKRPGLLTLGTLAALVAWLRAPGLLLGAVALGFAMVGAVVWLLVRATAREELRAHERAVELARASAPVVHVDARAVHLHSHAPNGYPLPAPPAIEPAGWARWHAEQTREDGSDPGGW
ncbi:hypothetical protein [Xylanimonas protaetiae]|uniref:Uncharacterized protein n=1 Tax=Xylanimonas protaetiae TaxID=2509457 RepID=A0A4P6F4I4_9MICO|nr:hypothetical protein [Xylanimonas protaetiae]QAY70484.1 hypothetical protein ET471_10955 [Xylanimonas protaetiae]